MKAWAGPEMRDEQLVLWNMTNNKMSMTCKGMVINAVYNNKISTDKKPKHQRIFRQDWNKFSVALIYLYNKYVLNTLSSKHSAKIKSGTIYNLDRLNLIYLL